RAVEPLITALKDEVWPVRKASAEALVQIGLPAVDSLIDALRKENGDLRQAVVGVLGRIGGARAVGALTAALGDEAADVGEAAQRALLEVGAAEPLIAALADEQGRVLRGLVRVLGQMGDAQAVEPLIGMLEDRDWRVRKGVVEALGQMGDARTVGPLIAALGDEGSTVQKSAVRVLGQMGERRAVEPLIALLKSEDRHVREEVAEALDRLGWQPDQDETGAFYWMAKGQWNQCAAIGAPAVEPLIAGLKSATGRHVRKAMIKALGRIGSARAVGALTAALGDEAADVGEAAQRALLEVGAAEPLIAALADEQGRVLRGLVRVLGQMGDAQAVEPLIGILGDTDWQVRKEAAEALDRLGWQPDRGVAGVSYRIAKGQWGKCSQIGAPAVELLIAALEDERGDVRVGAARALGRIGDARAVEPLIGILGDTDWQVRRVAAEALDRLGWQPDRSEAGARYWMAKGQWDECVAMGAPAVEPLITMLGAEDRGVRKAAAEVLGRMGEVRAVEPLIVALGDVRAAAAQALGILGDGRAVEPLIAALGDEDGDAPEAVIEALGRLGDARAVEPLIVALENQNYEVREASAGALGRLGDARAVEPLIARLWDVQLAVRIRVADVLVAMYRSQKLHDTHKRLILAQQSTITARHHDYIQRTNIDHPSYYSDCTHTDFSEHTDRGIGVDFPL
ncbi:MAG: HEAT repeat domain-containing protein, partial [Candidatus Methylomirabilia bacterium]